MAPAGTGLPVGSARNEKGRVATRPFFRLAGAEICFPGLAGYSFSRGVYFIGTPVDEGAGFPSIV
mgnify:CR=1 FL=1